jgi:hypothetical protein
MRTVVYAAIGVSAFLALTSADAAHAQKPSPAASSSSHAIPKSVKAVCKSKVLKIRTDKWIELKRRERCFT